MKPPVGTGGLLCGEIFARRSIRPRSAGRRSRADRQRHPAEGGGIDRSAAPELDANPLPPGCALGSRDIDEGLGSAGSPQACAG